MFARFPRAGKTAAGKTARRRRAASGMPWPSIGFVEPLGQGFRSIANT
jgi:hypothetical protein